MVENDLQIVLPESDEVLTCPRCKTANPLESKFCLNCGTRLHTPSGSNLKWSWIIILAVCFVSAIYYFYFRITDLEPQHKAPADISPTVTPNISPADTPTPRKAPVKVPEKQVSQKNEEAISPDTSSDVKIPAGIVLIKDISGKIINEIPVPVIAGGWVALPKQACLGGSEWVLKMGPDFEVIIQAGIYNDLDKVGLWRISEDFKIDGPELYPWAPDEPLTWYSLSSSNTLEPVELVNSSAQGFITEGTLTGGTPERGILMQQDRAVGWTFGDMVAGAFAWHGDEGKYLQPETRVDDFYRITFANGREEEFVRALAMGADYSIVERLEALARAFRFDPKLSAAETPVHLQIKTVVETMRKLAVSASKAGFNREVANIFDSQILVEAADADLLMNVTDATVQGYGFEEAVELVENVAEGLPTVSAPDSDLFDKIFSKLYQSWITDLINQGNLQEAWSAYRLGSRRLPDDVDIHLMGVQLALAENNWAEAENLLAMKEYPASLDDKIKNLQNQISELKGQEGKIVINFTPGSRQIPITAVLDQGSYQQFIVDTGASMVTIPSSTARDLGLVVDTRSPMRKVITAGGVQYAPEVMLSSITVEGWEVNNIKALVLDIPNQPDLGLLGLNYLEQFRMDMNTEEGILLLEPR
jgi:clan AA aspartic protease (TIGR02281 family)